MSYSFNQYSPSGSAGPFNVTFPYIDTDHVKVRLDGVLQTDYTWPTDSTILFNSPITGALDIRRESSRDERITNHQDASNLTEATLDQDATQLFYVAQEAFDAADTSIRQDTEDFAWDAEDQRIKNVALPSDVGDAVNRAYADGLFAATAGSPYVVLLPIYASIDEALTAAAGRTLFVPSGEYTISDDLVIPANVAVEMEHGAIFEVAATKTLHIEGPFSGSLSQHFAGAGQVMFGAAGSVAGQGSVEGLYLEWWYDGSGSYSSAFESACNAVPYYGGKGLEIRLLPKVYDFLTRVVVPTYAGINRALSFVGQGGAGASVKPTIRCHEVDAVGGAAETFYHIDFGQGDAAVTMKNISVSHASVPGADRSHGIAIRTLAANYIDFDQLWIDGFDIGLDVQGAVFYGRLHGVKTVYNYSIGTRITGNLVNNSEISFCMFSQTYSGTGFIGQNLGSNVLFRNVWAEGNGTYGMYFNGYHSISMLGFYCEDNGSYDVFADNSFPHAMSVLQITDGYWDGLQAPATPRIRANYTQLILDNCIFIPQESDNNVVDTLAPPVAIESRAPFGLRAGSDRCIARHCRYATPTLSNIPNDDGWLIESAKSPTTLYTDDITTFEMTVQPGTFIHNRDTSTPHILGWKVIEGGRIGATTLAASLTADSYTATTSKTLTLDDTTHPLQPGDYIVVADETFGGTGYARVEWVRPGPKVYLDRAATVGVTDKAVSYRAAVLETIYAYENEYIRKFAATEISSASGASTAIMEFAVSPNEKIAVQMRIFAADPAATDTMTYKTVTFVASEAAGTVTPSAAVYSDVVSGSTAQNFTITAVAIGSGFVRVFFSQTSGTTTDVAYTATLQGRTARPTEPYVP